MPRAALPFTNADGHGPDHARDMTGGAENVVNQIRRSCLAIGAGDADHTDLERRMPIKLSRDGGERATTVRRENTGQVCLDRALDKQRRGAPARRIRDKVVSVGIATAESREERSGLDEARVAANSADRGFFRAN